MTPGTDADGAAARSDPVDGSDSRTEAGPDRIRPALVVWGVLVSQVLLYPGLEDTVAALGGAGIRAGMWFLAAEFGAFVLAAVAWGVASDALGRRRPLVVAGAAGGGLVHLAIAVAPRLGVGFGGVLALRALGGALTIGAFSLSITVLMDASGEHGRDMGAAGTAIGLGAALGSVVGGQLAAVDPLAPLYGSAATLLAVAALAATVPDRAPGGAGPTPDGNDGDAGDVDARAVLDGLRERPTLLVPYAFGYVDRLTAGFFALVGVYYFRDAFGVDAGLAGLTLAAFFLPFAALQYPMGRLSDRIGRLVPVVGGSVLYGLSVVAVGLAPAYPVAAGLMVVVGVCGALVTPATMALVTDGVAPTARGAAMGGFNVFGSLGFLSGFLVGGVLASRHGYLPAFLAVGGLEVAIAVLALPGVRKIAARGDRGGTGDAPGDSRRPTEG